MVKAALNLAASRGLRYPLFLRVRRVGKPDVYRLELRQRGMFGSTLLGWVDFQPARAEDFEECLNLTADALVKSPASYLGDHNPTG
jgi:hypothetical protein